MRSSAALPFALLLSAAGPLVTSYYYDVMGNYDGALLAVGAASFASASLLGWLPEPVRPSTKVARAT
ncbi:hypothetical protein D3C83_138750 [compost metagenome]